jgi:hypothetical protein
MTVFSKRIAPRPALDLVVRIIAIAAAAFAIFVGLPFLADRAG